MWQDHLAWSIRKVSFSLQNKKKKRILFPVIFWNMFSAHPANAEQDLGDFFLSKSTHLLLYPQPIYYIFE